MDLAPGAREEHGVAALALGEAQGRPGRQVADPVTEEVVRVGAVVVLVGAEPAFPLGAGVWAVHRYR